MLKGIEKIDSNKVDHRLVYPAGEFIFSALAVSFVRR